MGSLRTDPIQTVFKKKIIQRREERTKLTITTLEPTWVYCTRHGYFEVHTAAYYLPSYQACPLCTPERIL
jgi:hypothetical protein